jgi:hypothetical protein
LNNVLSSLWDRHVRSPQIPLTKPVLILELVWALPLVWAGILGVLDPLLIGAAVVMALVPWLGRLVSGRLSRPAVIGGPLFLLILSAWFSMGSSYDPTLSWPMLVTLLASVNLFFAIINAPVQSRRMGGGLVLVAGLVALYFVGQYDHFQYKYEWGWPEQLGRFISAHLPDLVFYTPHPNAVAGFLEGAFLLSLTLAWQAPGKRRQLAWSLVVVLLAGGLFVTGSRGAGLGLIVAAGLWLILAAHRTQRLVMAGLAAAGSLSLLLLLWLSPFLWRLPGLASVLETVHGRLVLSRNTLYLLGDYSLTGIGLGDVFAMIYSRYQLLIHVPYMTYSHNLFLAVGLGLGVLGLAALAWLLAAFYRYVGRVEQTGLDRQSTSLFRASWLGVTVIFVHGLVDAPQFSAPGWPMPMLFALLGLTVAIGQSERKVEAKGLAWSYRRGLALTGLLLAGLVIWWQPLAGAWYANLGSIYQTRAELTPGLDQAAREAALARAGHYFEQALRWEPRQPTANRRMGTMALNREAFRTAITYLERAYQQEPGNQATLKALGYAYLWTGQLDQSEPLLRQLDDQDELVEELGNWQRWWASQERPDLALRAGKMAQRLSSI